MALQIQLYIPPSIENKKSHSPKFAKYVNDYGFPHYFISPCKQLHDIKAGHITTMEQQKARSQQRNHLDSGMKNIGHTKGHQGTRTTTASIPPIRIFNTYPTSTDPFNAYPFKKFASAGMALSMSITAYHFIPLLLGGNGNEYRNLAFPSISLQNY